MVQTTKNWVLQSRSVLFALAVHLVLFVLIGVSFTTESNIIVPKVISSGPIIQATVVSEQDLQLQNDKREQEKKQKKAEEERIKKELEKIKKEAQLLEQKRKEEKQRKIDDLKKQKAEEKRQQEEKIAKAEQDRLEKINLENLIEFHDF